MNDTDFRQRVERLRAHLGTRGVEEDLRDAQRYARDNVPHLVEIALQFAECKAGLREHVGDADARS